MVSGNWVSNKKHIVTQTYSSAAAIVEYVKQTYAIEYSNSGMVQLLERLGFFYKKTKLVPGKADPEKQLEFLDEYHRLKEEMGQDDKILLLKYLFSKFLELLRRM